MLGALTCTTSGYIGASAADKGNIYTTFKVLTSGSFIEDLDIAAKATPTGGSEPLGNNFSGPYLFVLISSSGIIVSMITMFFIVAWIGGWGKAMQGIGRTRECVLITATILHTPGVYGHAMISLQKEEFDIGGKAVHTSDCSRRGAGLPLLEPLCEGLPVASLAVEPLSTTRASKSACVARLAWPLQEPFCEALPMASQVVEPLSTAPVSTSAFVARMALLLRVPLCEGLLAGGRWPRGQSPLLELFGGALAGG